VGNEEVPSARDELWLGARAVEGGRACLGRTFWLTIAVSDPARPRGPRRVAAASAASLRRRNRPFAHIRTVVVPRAATPHPGRPLARSAASIKASATPFAPCVAAFRPLDLTDLIGSN
jgi:hypothetical protein